MKILITASQGPTFTGSYKKEWSTRSTYKFINPNQPTVTFHIRTSNFFLLCNTMNATMG